MTILHSVSALRERGLFADALRTLLDGRIAADDINTADVLRADLLERTGEYSKSRGLAEAASRRPSLSAADRSSCELVMARLELQSGNTDLAISRLRQAIAIASEARDFIPLCWAEL